MIDTSKVEEMAKHLLAHHDRLGITLTDTEKEVLEALAKQLLITYGAPLARKLLVKILDKLVASGKISSDTETDILAKYDSWIANVSVPARKHACGLLPHVHDPNAPLLNPAKLCIRGPVSREIDLSIRDARNQSQRQWCYGHGAFGCAQSLRHKLTGELVEYSPRFNAIMTKVLDGGYAEHEDGATGPATIEAMIKYGMVAESDFPYPADTDADDVAWAMPSDDVLAIGQKNQTLKKYYIMPGLTAPAIIDQALAAGYSVMLGMQIGEAWESEEVAKTGIIPDDPGDVIGGHMTVIDGKHVINSADYYQDCNSWGPEWGTTTPNGFKGYCYIPRKQLANPVRVMFLAVLTNEELGN